MSKACPHCNSTKFKAIIKRKGAVDWSGEKPEVIKEGQGFDLEIVACLNKKCNAELTMEELVDMGEFADMSREELIAMVIKQRQSEAVGKTEAKVEKAEKAVEKATQKTESKKASKAVETVEDDEDEEEGTVDYSAMDRDTLKELCEERGLEFTPKTTTKTLVKILEDDDASIRNDDADEDDEDLEDLLPDEAEEDDDDADDLDEDFDDFEDSDDDDSDEDEDDEDDEDSESDEDDDDFDDDFDSEDDEDTDDDDEEDDDDADDIDDLDF